MKSFTKKRGPPGGGAAAELVLACRGLYDAIDRLDAMVAASVSLSRSDLRALNVLEQGPVKASHMGRRLGLTAGSVTALIDRLEARGLVRREDDPEDRRGVLVTPTAELFARVGTLYRGVAERVQALADRYGETEAAAATRHVLDITRAYAAAVQPAPGPPGIKDRGSRRR